MSLAEWTAALRSSVSVDVRDAAVHLRRAGEWLLLAQERGGGGYAHSYDLRSGWRPPYPETTGYIIPTMLALAAALGEPAFSESARRAGRWLLGRQGADGSFSGLDGRPYVFDTAQALAGLLAMHEDGGDAAFLAAARRAGAWLAGLQEADGSWVRNAYRDIPHSYYVKAAAPLLRLGRALPDSALCAAARRNVAWTLAQRLPSGLFRRASFAEGEPPFLHTIAYILEGLLEAHAFGETAALEAARSLAAALLAAERRDFILGSRYGEDGAPTDRQRCVVGLAQWAGAALRLFRLTGDRDLYLSAVKNIYHLKARQVLEGPENLRGALPASLPFWGDYVGFSFVNWGVKYFIDALLEARAAGPLAPHQEQQVYVSGAFRSAKVCAPPMELGPWDRRPLAWIAEEIEACREGFPPTPLMIADVGAVRGAWVRALRERFPTDTVLGVDPSYADGTGILEGSAYRLPFADRSVHVLLYKEVFQHLSEPGRAFAEISRVARPGGAVLIMARNPLSALGALKRYYEIRGRWMYPWDSAFRERWYRRSQWERMLRGVGALRRFETIDNPSGRRLLGRFENRYFLFSIRIPEAR